MAESKTQKDQGKALYSQAIKLSESVETTFPDLAKALGTMVEKHPADFQSFILTSGYGQRKTYYLVEINKAFEGLSVPKQRLLGIGWTKAQILAKHITSSNANKLMTLAEENSVENLKRILAKKRKANRAALFYYDDDEWALLAKGLTAYGAVNEGGRGLSGKEDALLAVIRAALKAKKDKTQSD